VKLARFLAEIRVRDGTMIPEDLDPIGIILTRISMNPHSVESRALRKATLAVIATEGHMTEADLWALGKDALGLLDALAVERLTARYRPRDLEAIAGRLRGEG
jgi:hypothetical protein